VTGPNAKADVAVSALTRKRDLRTGKSIWLAHRRPPIDAHDLVRSVKTDIAIVGAGITGALIAETLTDAGLDVVVVDRRGPVEGSTAASTAMLQYELDTPLHLMAKRIGLGQAESLWRRSRQAVDTLRERTERLGIEADTATRGSIYLDGNILDAKGLAREADARRRAGFEIELLGPKAVEDRYGIRDRHAIVGYGNYSADPRKLAAGYLNAAITRGARLYAPVEIAAVEPNVKGVKLRSQHGFDIQARHAIFATGYEMLKGIPRKGNKIISSWSIATKPQRRAIWPTAALIWEAADPYLYIRSTPHGEVICGGEDEEIADASARDAKLDEKARTLSRKLAALLPDIDAEPVFAWAGSFGTSPVGSPTIGRIPKMPNCYAAMGYGGNGITFAMMAAQMLRGAIVGNGDADAGLVSFHRKF